MSSREKTKLGAAAAMLLLAVVLFYLLSPREGAIADSAEAHTLWFCTACKSGFDLTGEQTVEMVRIVTNRTLAHRDAAAATPRRLGRTVLETTKCPFCGERAGIAARRCPECNEIFAARGVSGEIAVCPACGWDPVTGQKAEGRRVASGR